MTDVRHTIVEWAQWAVKNHGKFTYSEGPQRMSGIGYPGHLPVIADCSAFVTLCYNWAGAADPNGLHYNHTGYTGTLVSHGKPVTLAQLQVGDLVIYGPGTGQHTSLVVAVGKDPLTVSHGQQGDPSYVHVSQDSRPYRFFTYSTKAVAVVHTPPVPAPKPVPVPPAK